MFYERPQSNLKQVTYAPTVLEVSIRQGEYVLHLQTVSLPTLERKQFVPKTIGG